MAFLPCQKLTTNIINTVKPREWSIERTRELEATDDSREINASVIAFRKRLEEKIRKAYPKPTPELDPVSEIKTVKCESADWAGEWSSSFGTMKLQLAGEGCVVGWYGTETKTLEGTIDPNDSGVYRGRWRHMNSDATRVFEFRWVAKGEFRDAWTAGSSKPSDVAVNWSGTKVNTALPGIPDPKGAFHCELADWAREWCTNFGIMTLAFTGREPSGGNTALRNTKSKEV